MGNELDCTLRRGRETFTGRALLESTEILFRGDIRLKIPFSSITAVDALNGQLRIRTSEEINIFHLGRHAENWRNKIAIPKPVLAKLGVKPGDSITLLGDFPPDFITSLKKWGTAITVANSSSAAHIIFLAAGQRADLRQLSTLRKAVRGATALWIVYPKGQTSITEAQVRSAGLASGLLDIKVVSFSPTHTALKFVLPKNQR